MTAAESVDEEAVEMLAQALFRAVGGADWSHDALFFDRERFRRQARGLLADTLPLLRPSDVPHLERRIRESIAGEIEADTTRPDDEPYRWWHFWSWNRGFHAGWNSRGEVAARAARGQVSS